MKDRPGTIEGKGPLDTSDRPENKNTSQTYNNGYPWNVPEAGGIFEKNYLVYTLKPLFVLCLYYRYNYEL